MITDLQAPKNFEERMTERIKKDIGDLITDEELRKIVSAGIQKAFFDERRDQYNRSSKPFIVEALNEHLSEAMKDSVSEWMKENKEQVSQLVKEAVSQGVGQALISAVTNKFNADLCAFQNNIVNTITGMR